GSPRQDGDGGGYLRCARSRRVERTDEVLQRGAGARFVRLQFVGQAGPQLSQGPFAARGRKAGCQLVRKAVGTGCWLAADAVHAQPVRGFFLGGVRTRVETGVGSTLQSLEQHFARRGGRRRALAQRRPEFLFQLLG